MNSEAFNKSPLDGQKVVLDLGGFASQRVRISFKKTPRRGPKKQLDDIQGHYYVFNQKSPTKRVAVYIFQNLNILLSDYFKVKFKKNFGL